MCDVIATAIFTSACKIVVRSDVGGYRIVGCPKSIEDRKYARNALIFNVVFVFTEELQTAAFEPVVQKLGDAFKTYEVRFHNEVFLLLVWLCFQDKIFNYCYFEFS